MLKFLKERLFWINVLFVIIAALVLVYVVQLWLKQYTHHGQQLTMQEFINMPITKAEQLAAEHSFKLLVTDSVHIIGKPGGMIINQNPNAGDLVKQDRKVYVTTTKYAPDMISVEDLPELYGKSFERKKRALEAGYSLKSEKIGSIYDKGPPGYIMMVIYEQDTLITHRRRNSDVRLPKGATLKFVVSKSQGGDVPVPDLVCMTYEAAKFVISSYELSQSGVIADATVDNYSQAYIYKQEPAFEEGKLISSGTGLTLYLSQDPPEGCN